MEETFTCEECQASFIGEESQMCDIIDGQYTEWTQIRCPHCNNVVQEW